jgi:hypothetical protein
MARSRPRRAEEVTGLLDETQLRLMSPEERAQLARTLASLDLPAPLDDPKTASRRKVVVFTTLVCCGFLAAWIVVLALTLPSGFRTEQWRGVWVGFDVAELAGFCAVAWAAWRGRQILILSLIVTATLLCCDAWFDLTLDWGTRWFWLSAASAAFVELPLAALMLIGVRRMLRLNAQAWMTLEGETGPVPPLWQLEFLGQPRPPRTRPRRPHAPPAVRASGSRPARSS